MTALSNHFQAALARMVLKYLMKIGEDVIRKVRQESVIIKTNQQNVSLSK